MSRFATAREIIQKLGGRFAGHSGTCKCPAHEDRSPSLSVSQTRDGRVLVHCHAGCDQLAVIAELKRIGLWGDGELGRDPSYPAHFTTKYDGVDKASDRVKRQEALDVWDKAGPIKGTHGEAYLKARAIRMPPSCTALRYAPALYHSPTKRSYKAIVARLEDDAGFCAVQRTYLDAAEPRKALIEPNKMSKGPMAAGAVRLFPRVDEVLGLAEGIETAFSAAQLYSIPVWATLSAQRLSKIEIPATVQVVTIFADKGQVGIAEAFKAQDIYEGRGLKVEVITPSAHYDAGEKDDFNDILRRVA